MSILINSPIFKQIQMEANQSFHFAFSTYVSNKGEYLYDCFSWDGTE